MTVKELIKVLEAFDPDLPIYCINGDEQLSTVKSVRKHPKGDPFGFRKGETPKRSWAVLNA